MSKKNFKVATAENGKTPKSNIKHPFATIKVVEETNVPTGKVVTLEDKKKRKEAREEAYRNFRIAALKRRAKRIGVPEEKVPELIEKLKAQLDAPKQYTILVLYNQNDDKMITEMLANNKIKYLFKSNSHVYIDGDATTLATIRELMPDSAKIHPYAKRLEPIIEAQKPKPKTKKPKNRASIREAAKAAKAAKRAANIKAHGDRKLHAQQQKEAKCKKKRKEMKAEKLFKKRAQKASKKTALTVAHKAKKNAVQGKEKASTNLKNAA